MQDGFEMMAPHNGVVIICNDNKYSFESLYKAYRQLLLNEAERYLKGTDSCEEIVEDLFVRLYFRSFPLIVKTSVPAYLLMALRNSVFNHIRDKTVYKKHLLSFASSEKTSQTNTEQLVDLKELQERVSFFVRKMPPKYREVYLLRDQTNFTVRKMSAFLNRPVDTVEKQLRKATWFLRNNLKQYKEYNFMQ
jgi:RNA polymerase sigma factor (sigma-70 family)